MKRPSPGFAPERVTFFEPDPRAVMEIVNRSDLAISPPITLTPKR